MTAVIGIESPPAGARQHPEAPSVYLGPDGSVWQRINVTHPERRQWLRRKMETDRDGYLRVRINGRNRLVHREVYRAFSGPLIQGLVVCHVDGDQQNNRPANLLQASQRTNIAHKAAHGTEQVGEKHGRSRYTDAIVRSVKAAITQASRSPTGRLGKGEAARIAEAHGVSQTLIHDLSRGRKGWAHV